MNTQMTDKDLDMLFAESAKRQPEVAHINATVMRTVRRDLRLKKLRKWAKLLGICFGLPVAVVLYIYALFVFMPEMPEQLRVLSIALPIATILALAAQHLHYFSPEV
jgi:hypothetical protein